MLFVTRLSNNRTNNDMALGEVVNHFQGFYHLVPDILIGLAKSTIDNYDPFIILTAYVIRKMFSLKKMCTDFVISKVQLNHLLLAL